MSGQYIIICPYNAKGGFKISTQQKSSTRKRFELRLDDETSKDLEYCSIKLNITKTEVVKKGIKRVKEDIKK